MIRLTAALALAGAISCISQAHAQTSISVTQLFLLDTSPADQRLVIVLCEKSGSRFQGCFLEWGEDSTLVPAVEAALPSAPAPSSLPDGPVAVRVGARGARMLDLAGRRITPNGPLPIPFDDDIGAVGDCVWDALGPDHKAYLSAHFRADMRQGFASALGQIVPVVDAATAKCDPDFERHPIETGMIVVLRIRMKAAEAYLFERKRLTPADLEEALAAASDADQELIRNHGRAEYFGLLRPPVVFHHIVTRLGRLRDVTATGPRCGVSLRNGTGTVLRSMRLSRT